MQTTGTWLRRPLALVAIGAALSGAAGESLVAAAPEERGADLRNSKPYRRWRFSYERHGRRHPFEASHDRAAALAVLQAETARHPDGALNWEPLGPAPILWVPNASGRVAAVAVDPGNASHWLIGAAQGGVWQTTDAGATWAARTDGQASLAMGAIAFAPGSPNVVYAGTGEAHFSQDSYGGAGLLKSTDGGTTWILLAEATFRGSAFSDIRVDPTNANVATAAVTYGVAGRYVSYPPWLPPRGVFRTTDGGANWALTLSGVEATDLETMPGSFSAQYAGVKYQNFNEPGGIFRSFDGGQSWTTVSGPWPASQVGRVELAVAPSAPNRMFVAIDGAQSSSVGPGLWVTDNAWDPSPSWSPVPAPPCPDNQYWYDFEASVDPQDPQRLFLGGVALCRWNGASWSVVDGAIHSDQHAMAWAGPRLIVGNDGGVYSTTNGGGTWSNHNTNLSLTQFYDGALHPRSPTFALGGTQDNGTQKWTGAAGWPQVFGADGGDCEISASHPERHWAVTTQMLGVYRTLDGNTMEFAGSGLGGLVPFIGRLVKCPANDDVFLAGTNPLRRTSSFFGPAPPTWSPNAPPFNGGTVQSIEFAPSDPTCGTSLAGTDWPVLMLTTDGGGAWRDIHAGPVLPSAKYPIDLAFDPTDANVVYVALSGFDVPGDAPGHLFQTQDALSPAPTWTRIGPPVNLPHNSVVVDPARPDSVYVGTDLGVWRSTDAGGTWAPLPGLPNVAVFDLHANAATGSLVAFTHGRGAWRLPLASAEFGTAASQANEGDGVATMSVWIQRSDGGTLPQPVTVDYLVLPGSAQPGLDYVPSSGTITFPAGTPNGGTAAISVPLVDDASDEPAETFLVRLTTANGTLLGSVVQHTVTIVDDDAPPTVATTDGATVEGHTGTSDLLFNVSLSNPSGFPVSLSYGTAAGTATAGSDYIEASGVLSFATGTREATVSVAVVGDGAPEPDETFFLQLSAPVNATLADGLGLATILDDDGTSLSSRALVRGSRLQDDLAAVPGPSPEDLFHLSQSPRSSYEVVVDAGSGDVQPLVLQRVAGDGVGVLQSASPVGTGGAWSLRWENTLAQPIEVQYARVRSGQCGSDCGADDTYRVRMYETTLAGSRFNNSGSQVSVLVLQNSTSDPVSGHQFFWSATGTLLATRPFGLGPRASQVLALPSVSGLQGASGSLTVTHDGRYGALAGKVVSVEPASGLAFDTPLFERR